MVWVLAAGLALLALGLGIKVALLRHLFARAFYNVCRDVAKLADVLGHSSLETTRLYLISTGKEHERQLERLGFVK